MVRMGHDSERAALIYLHSSAERQRTLADAVGAQLGPNSPSHRTASRLGHLAREWHETAAPR